MEITQINNLAIPRSLDRSTLSRVSGNWLNYFWVFWAIVISSNPGLPLLLGNQEGILTVTFTAMVLILLWRRDFQWPQWSAIPFVVFGLLLIMQSFSFQFFPYITIIGFFVRLSIGLMVWMLVPRLPYIFIRVMVFLAVLSFPFWIIGLTGLLNPLIIRFALHSESISIGTTLSIIVQTYIMVPEGFLTSNSGMFWERGAFAGYLNLASMFLLLLRPEFSDKTYKRYLFILSAGVLSSMSTAGYLVLGILLFLHGIRSKPMLRLSGLFKYKASFSRVILVGAFLLTVGIIAWGKVPFLGEKVNQQYRITIRQGSGGSEKWYLTRFGSAVFDWEYVKARPFTGWGLHDKTRYALHGGEARSELWSGMGNGLSDFVAKFGLIGLITFACLVWSGLFRLSRWDKKLAFIALGLIFIMLNGECFLNRPFFMSLMFSNLRKV
jgi:hypothetical protein